ncbi:unnamed protein product [Ostreobium quekettii]|uniref:CSD domain-containing protein n=1 Tax=Ostreobium quekettii TaxID=121088 RepID=A0A8S1IVT5_9CHLO|nr:unnamed protein product [Ostreobium quekettii]|eukprot:evm.model.scf_255EXC.6 EVM.evm.TU.scf_255EXC.6   scf_255EXC:50532-65392(-)
MASLGENGIVARAGGDGEGPGAEGGGQEGLEQGILVAVKDALAFVRCPTFVDPLVFNATDFIPKDATKEGVPHLPAHLSPGDEVAFKVGARVDGELRAVEVRKSAAARERRPSTAQPPFIGQHGQSDALRNDFRALSGISGFSSALSSHFSGLSDLLARSESLGQSMGDSMGMEMQSSTREEGIVARLKDTNGFINRPRPHLGRIFFHFKYLRPTEGGGTISRLEIGTEVSYVVCREGGRMFAADVELMPKGTIVQEVELEGHVKGRVIKPALSQPSDVREDGIVGYVDEEGHEQRCYYGNHQVEQPDVELDERDEIEFRVICNNYRREGRALEVRLISKAPERRELGKVAVLKNNFGFIKCCERHNDVLFHFSELDGLEPADLVVGDDVEFAVKWDREKGKQLALKVRKAKPGSAVFELLSAEVYYGLVVERLGLWKQYGPGSHGVVLFERNGCSEKLTFGGNDLEDRQLNPQVGDKVSFRIATNLAQAKSAEKLDGPAAKYGGRRATEVALVRYMGKVASMFQNGSYGFIDYEHERGMSRIFFHCSEVERGVYLRPDDVVKFVRVYNPQKQQHQARRLQRIQEAPVAPKGGLETKGSGSKLQLVPSPLTLEKPSLTLKLGDRSTANPQSARGGAFGKTARGPDGTKGFPSGRGRCLDPPIEELSPRSSKKLDPAATPFIPRSMSGTDSIPSPATLEEVELQPRPAA